MLFINWIGRTLDALDSYSRTADLGEDQHIQLVKPLIALDVRNVNNGVTVMGFDLHDGSETLSTDSLVTYTNDTDVDFTGIEAAVLFSDEVTRRAKEAHGNKAPR